MNAMCIKTFSSQLLEELNTELETIAIQNAEGVILASKSIVAIKSTLIKLKEFVHEYTFSTSLEEIEFFKTIKPSIASQYYYYDNLFNILINQPINDGENLRAYYINALNPLNEYSIANKDLYQYYLSNSTDLDEKYFTRCGSRLDHIDADCKFSTGYDGILSRIIANQLLKNYIIKKLNSETTVGQLSPLTWTGTKAALIEIIYALQCVEVINKGKSDIREIATSFEQLFHIDLGNYYRQFQDIRLRKKGKTNFLDDMKLSLEKRMDEFS